MIPPSPSPPCPLHHLWLSVGLITYLYIPPLSPSHTNKTLAEGHQPSTPSPTGSLTGSSMKQLTPFTMARTNMVALPYRA